jgi:hypothetical protein
LVESSTESTFKYLIFVASVVLVALTEKSAFYNTYGKSASRVTLILVFNTGETDAGLSARAALIVSLSVNEKELAAV